jgi:hypothetical protein
LTFDHLTPPCHIAAPAEDIATGESDESNQKTDGLASSTRIMVKRKEKDATNADPTAAATFGFEKKTDNMKENVIIDET